MWHRLNIILSNPAKSLWVHPTLGALFAIVFSLLAKWSGSFFPADLVPNISVDTLSDLLNILSSSMLAVTTFSLSIMVSALASGSNSATPRARLLIMGDDTARLAIASFITAFIYAVIAKIALSLEYYGTQGRFILLISTILMLMYIIFTLIRWVQTLSQLGSLGDAVSKVAKKASESLAHYRVDPQFGAVHAQPQRTADYIYRNKKTGYLCDIDFVTLQQLAQHYALHIHICERPGKFFEPQQQLLAVFFQQQPLSAEQLTTLEQQLSQTILIENERRYDQDPRFGLLVLSEVAQRAMSAATNDPVTAMTAIHTITQVLIDTQAEPVADPIQYSNLSLVAADEQDWIMGTFAPIVRDSVNNLEVNQRLLRCLGMIYRHVPEAKLQHGAYLQAEQLLQRCLNHFEYAADCECLEEIFAKEFP